MILGFLLDRLVTYRRTPPLVTTVWWWRRFGKQISMYGWFTLLSPTPRDEVGSYKVCGGV